MGVYSKLGAYLSESSSRVRLIRGAFSTEGVQSSFYGIVSNLLFPHLYEPPLFSFSSFFDKS